MTPVLPPPLSEQELQRIDELDKAATPGPWPVRSEQVSAALGREGKGTAVEAVSEARSR